MERFESAVTVGTFDGVHRGHRAVLATLALRAAEEGLAPLAITFDRHPLEVVAPDRNPGLLCSPDDRDDMISDCGVKPVRLRFNEELRSTTAADWMRQLKDKWNARLLVLGYDNTFGCDGLDMAITDYRRIGSHIGITVEEAPVVGGCSSSAARKAVAGGRMDEAERILGRPFSISGCVEKGQKLGRTIGIPTANISPDPKIVLPAPGVYCAFARLAGKHEGKQEKFMAVVNVGAKPTVSEDSKCGIEAHLLGFHGDLYGKNLTVDFQDRLRDTVKFPSLAELKDQIWRDIDLCKQKLTPFSEPVN